MIFVIVCALEKGASAILSLCRCIYPPPRPEFPPSISFLMKNILESGREGVPKEIMALAINLSTDPRCALGFAEGLTYLIKRALKTKDSLLMKVVRNLAAHDHENIKFFFLDYIDNLMKVVRRNSSDAMVVEVLGVFGNLTIPNLYVVFRKGVGKRVG